jgi:NAD+ synthase
LNIIAEIKEKAPFLAVNEALVTKILSEALREEVEKTGFNKCLIGLSGGIDSALSLRLAVLAMGKENVIAVRMPYKTSSQSSLDDAQVVIDATDVQSVTIDITPQIDVYFKQMPTVTPLRRGNKMARERMTILYDLSMYYGALVIGTSNRTELLLGYGTQYGDTVSAVNPLGDLYKTQVRQLAAYLNIAEQIINKPPSADLWPDQTDEGELGFSYFDVDRLLYHIVDQHCSLEQLRTLSFTEQLIQAVTKRIKQNQFKRIMPVILKVSNRTIGVDFRYLRDWGL